MRNQRQHVRGALHELLRIADTLKRVLTDALILVGQTSFPRELLPVVAISFRRGHATGRSVRPLQITGVRQVSHDVATAGRPEPLPIAARYVASSDRVLRGNET